MGVFLEVLQDYNDMQWHLVSTSCTNIACGKVGVV